MSELLLSLGISLGLTVLIELSLSFLLGIRSRDLLLVFLMNLMTNPAAVFGCYVLKDYVSAFWLTALIELSVIAAEGLCCQARGENIRHPWRLALLLNLCSYTIGEVIQYISMC